MINTATPNRSRTGYLQRAVNRRLGQPDFGDDLIEREDESPPGANRTGTNPPSAIASTALANPIGAMS